MINTSVTTPAAVVTRVERPQPANESHVNPLLQLHLLLYGRYKWAVVLGIVLALCGSAAVWLSMPPKYEVIGYIRVKPYIPPVMNPTDQTGVLPMFETFVSLQVSLLQSQRVLDQASLKPEWKALGRFSPQWGAKIPADSIKVQHPKSSEIITVGVTDEDVNAATIAVKAILQAYEATSGDSDGASNSQRLQVLEELRTSLTNQKRALADQVLSLANEYGSDDLQNRYQFKLAEQNKLESELQAVALEISIVLAAHGETVPSATASAPAATGPAVASATVPASQPATQPLTREDVARFDPMMKSDLEERSRQTLQLNQLRMRFGDNYPQVLVLRNSLQALDEQINALLAFYQSKPPALLPTLSAGPEAVVNRLPELRAREKNIHELFERVQAETKALGQLDLKIRKLKSDQDAISHKLDETSARIDQLNLESTMANRISIMSYGESPTAPVSSKRKPLTAAVGLLGLAVGAGVVALRGLADRRVASLLHMQQLAPTIRVLGMLPVLPEDLADPKEVSLAAHCVHQIRNLLNTVMTSDKGRVLAITSPSSGDGKTSLALALGMSFAVSGSRTLLIDCDLVAGGLSRRLNAVAHRNIGMLLQRQGVLTEKQVTEASRIAKSSHKKLRDVLVELGYVKVEDLQQALKDQQETSVGVMDALTGDPLTTCIAPTGTKDLYVLPVGETASDHHSQISAKALRRLLKEARGRFEIIIIDTGPLLGSLEASVVTREADEVVLAIARGASSILVSRTVEFLGSLGAHLGGVVFNRATPGDVAHSSYHSLESMRSQRAADETPRSQGALRDSHNSRPRLGPIAAAVASNAALANGNGSVSKSSSTTDAVAESLSQASTLGHDFSSEQSQA